MKSSALSSIKHAVARLFDRAKARLLGGHRRQGIEFLYTIAAKEAGTEPRGESSDTLKAIAEGYLDAERHRATAQVIHDVSAFLQDAQRSGVKTDVETVLGGQLADTWGRVTASVDRIVSTESQRATSLGTVEGITKINALRGIEDPVVYFVIVRDQHCCEECHRLHMLPDGETPRAWRLSEVGAGYHRRGENNPKMSGLHPHCRCRPAALLPGWGFVKGRAAWIGDGHDELARQRQLYPAP